MASVRILLVLCAAWVLTGVPVASGQSAPAGEIALQPLAQALSQFAAQTGLQVVYVSVDPERDTPTRLRAFTEQFDTSFVGLTGPMDQLAPVWKAYGVSVVRRELPGSKSPTYLIHHSASVFLIDAAGRLRVMAPFGTPSDDVLHDIRALLKE